MKHLSNFGCISCLLLLAVLLAACGGDANSSPASTGPIDPSTSASTQPTPLPAITAPGHFREYPLPQTDDGMMRPAIDHEGRIWFGEMNQNFLAVFDPRTQHFQQMVPPHGSNGIMGIAIAPDDSIWFAEQYANYIGHYFPSTGQYQTYHLPSLTVPDPSTPGKKLVLPSAPNDLALDAHGNVWFTEMNADSLGKLDPHTGVTRQYPISRSKSVQQLDPYGVAIDPQGMVWFTEASNDHVGRLDPNSGKIDFFTMAGPNLPLMEIASDAHGTIWITSFNAGLLLSLNPQSGVFTPYYTPHAGNTAGGIYGLLINPSGEIWITLSAENMIARLDVAANRFVVYAIPTNSSLPLGVVMGANHTLWFTESGKDKIGMLQP